MYKKTSQSQQRRVSRIQMKDLPSGGVDITPEQEREALVARWKQLVEEAGNEENPAKKKHLGKKIQELQRKISAIRPKNKGAPDWGNHFINVARETLTKFQFQLISDEAQKRCEQTEKKT